MPYRLLSRVSSERSNVLIMFYIFFQGLRAVLQTSLVIASLGPKEVCAATS